MMTTEPDPDDPFPPYAFIPGGPWPRHAHASPGQPEVPPIHGADWSGSAAYRRGIALFIAGYYWEAHEAWEPLWHAHGRVGPTADVIKGLIKLAAAGVKVRQRQRHGVVTHARRAAALFAAARAQQGRFQLGLDLDAWTATAQTIAAAPPDDPGSPGAAVIRAFSFRIEPFGTPTRTEVGPGLPGAGRVSEEGLSDPTHPWAEA
jgi:hypothetical protein